MKYKINIVNKAPGSVVSKGLGATIIGGHVHVYNEKTLKLSSLLFSHLEIFPCLKTSM